MTVYFANKGKIDLDVIRVMGVSVKSKDNPIGYFGTGLKFAIATLLRTDHQVILRRGSESFEFTAQDVVIRGEGFKRCFMNDEPLPFTTELGKNWEVWQSYRELHSNTLDEDGVITDKKVHNDTVIEVNGSGIEREFADRWNIFLNTDPLTKCDGLEIHPGRTKNIYYRGVRCGVLPEPTLFTYNITSPTELSEDRIIRSQWDVEYKLETMIPACTDKEVFVQILGQTETFDGNLNFTYCGNPSKEFLDAAKQFRSGSTGNRIWKYQVPVSEKFTMKLPVGAKVIRMDGENGMLWLWAVVDTSAPIEERNFEAFKAGGTMPDDLSCHEYVGMASIFIQAELMLYFFEVKNG